MSENAPQQRTLTFNDDGTIDPAQLEGMSQEFIDKVTAPDFIIRARLQIAADKERQSFLRGAREIRRRAQSEHEARRPSGISGRQRKRLRRLARKVTNAAVH